MKKLLLLLIPTIFYAKSFQDLIKEIDNNLLIKAKSQEVLAKSEILKSNKSKNYPNIDAQFSTTYLKDRPSIYFHMPTSSTPTKLQVGERKNFIGEIDISYPLFTGFAIENIIDKSRFDLEKSKLQMQDTKRKLYLKVASLYGQLYSLNHALIANKDAYKAIQNAWKKANGFYKAELLAQSELANIKAKKYELKAKLEELKSQKEQILNTLSYITDQKISTIYTKSLPNIRVGKKDSLLKEAVSNREDIKALKKSLKMDESDIIIAKSKNYPTISLIGAIKTEGNTLKLNGDGYTNPNKSYIATSVKWNLFDKSSTSHKIEAAKAKLFSKQLYIKDYQNIVKTKLLNEFLKLKKLKLQKEAKKAQLKAQNEYFQLIKGRFINHLSSSDELSRAIAKKAEAKAKLEKIKAEIFIQKCKILLQSSLKEFKKGVKIR